MSLRKQWLDLDRATVARAPDRYGMYELGDEEGNVVDRDAGVLRDDLKETLAYGDAATVRWQEATSREHAERLLAEHR